MNSPIVGIDLGTTNSLVAVASWPRATDVPRVLPDSAGSLLVPSVVRFQDAGVLVGAQAKADAAKFPHTTIASVKRLMGRSLADARADIPYLSYAVVQGDGETARVSLPAIGSQPARLVAPQEVSAHVLRALRAQASAALGVDVTRAVITVPAYFDDAQRQATRDAARLAGLEAVRLVAEPTAAALAYGLGLRAAGTQKPQSIVVYDLGGGTFDVSVLRLTPDAGKNGADAFEVLSTAGDTHLGGDDIDFAIVKWLVEQAVAIKPDLPMPSDAQRRRLLAEAERVKIALSDAERVDVDLRWLIGAEHGSDLVGRASSPAALRTAPDAHQVSLQSKAGGDARPTWVVRLDRPTLDALAKPLIDRTIAACQRALRDAKRSLDGEGIDTVILVGGATRMPLVRARVREFFKLEPYTAIDPDQAVALGAAVQASVLDSANGPAGTSGAPSAMLLDVIPLSLGLETAGGGVAKIIMRNSPVPARASEMFSTQKDGQGSILLNVVQGEREMAADCRSLGTYHLRGIPAMPAGLPQLRVDFFVDANGILSVTAVEQRSQRRLAVQIVPNHGLTREEVDRIERESFAFAKEDMARHRVADLIANSTLDAGWIRTQLARYGSALPTDQRDAIAAALAELDTLIARATASWSSVEPDGFMRAKERLDRASMPLHEAAMTQSLREMTDRPPASA